MLITLAATNITTNTTTNATTNTANTSTATSSTSTATAPISESDMTKISNTHSTAETEKSKLKKYSYLIFL